MYIFTLVAFLVFVSECVFYLVRRRWYFLRAMEYTGTDNSELLRLMWIGSPSARCDMVTLFVEGMSRRSRNLAYRTALVVVRMKDEGLEDVAGYLDVLLVHYRSEQERADLGLRAIGMRLVELGLPQSVCEHYDELRNAWDEFNEINIFIGQLAKRFIPGAQINY